MYPADAGAVNGKLQRRVQAAQLASHTYHIVCECVQHRTAKIIENLRMELGFAEEVFIAAKTFQSDAGNVIRDVVGVRSRQIVQGERRGAPDALNSMQARWHMFM
eukprot:9093544-Prorocentrum_lima.AAC.1